MTLKESHEHIRQDPSEFKFQIVVWFTTILLDSSVILHFLHSSINIIG